ncbi:MAG TPA: glutamate--tRNA ligase [Stellaceae bacterium]|nr:glutamate--tRNA ligase [Stellaceae bacterium]
MAAGRTELVRFAPSPTGRLHLGNGRAAVINWLFARRHGGRFMLRLDDTDIERSTAENAAAIETDLAWLGVTWDLFARQSDRFDRYRAAIETLKASGRVYACFETPEELDFKRKLALSRHKPPIYDRAGLALTEAERAAFIAQGRTPLWRFKLDPGPIAWTDRIRGPVRFLGENLSDPALILGDDRPLYLFASVVDDLDFGVTTIIRGEDHVANTAVQIQLFEALGGQDFTMPAFAHYALFADAGGEKLSKRTGALSLGTLRDKGIEPMAVMSLLAKLGTSDPIEVRATPAELVAEFGIEKFGRGQAKFDVAELDHLNARLLHMLPYEAVAERLPAGAGAEFWAAVRPNLATLAEAETWWRVVNGPIEPLIDEPDFTAAAARLLPAAPFDGETWRSWTEAVKTATGRKGKALFLPLRRALTGADHGPELAALLPLIGRERAVARLEGTG